MAKEILELQVNSNVKGVTKDVDALATSVEKAYDAEAELSKNIQLQNQFIADQEVELARLKAVQDSIPKGSWYGGQSKLTADIKKVTSTLRTEKAALKKLTTEQNLNTKAVRSAAIAQKKNNNAAIRGIQHFQIMGVSIRKLKFMVRGVVPMFKLLFGTIRNGIRSTGIGILILALISIGTSMKKSVAGGKAFKAMMEGIGVVTGAITDTLTFLGDTMLSVFGFDSSTNAAVTAADELEKAYERLAKRMDEITLKELQGSKAKADNQKIIDDTTKSEEERLQASKENAEEDYKILLAKLDAQVKLRQSAANSNQAYKNWHNKEKKWAKERNDWEAVAADKESEFSKSRDKSKEASKKLIKAEQDLQKLRNELYEQTAGAEDEITEIKSFNIDKIADEEEKAREKREKAADDWRAKQRQIASDELTIAKQLEKIKNELSYRELETEKEVEEAKLQDAKEAAEKAIEDSKASAETKTAALLVIEKKYQSDLAIIQQKHKEKDDAAWDKKIADNDAWNKQQIADQEKTDAKKKKIDDTYEAEKQKSIVMGFDAASSLAKEGSVAAKGIAVARTIYNTQQAIMNAMATVPAPWNIAQSIATGVMGAASIQKILSTNPEAGGGGGGGASATPTPPAPEMMSGAFTLSGGQAVEPARAYVVSDDITNNQNKLAIIRRRATI